MPCGCSSFLWFVLVVFLGLLALVSAAANPWILVLGLVAFVIAVPLFILWRLGRIAFRYPIIAILVIVGIILIALVQRS